MEVRLAPGETRKLRMAPSTAETTKLLLTPAQKAAGPEDAAVSPLSFSPVEKLLRAALLGERRFLPLYLISRLGLGSLLYRLALRRGWLHLRLRNLRLSCRWLFGHGFCRRLFL